MHIHINAFGRKLSFRTSDCVRWCGRVQWLPYDTNESSGIFCEPVFRWEIENFGEVSGIQWWFILRREFANDFQLIERIFYRFSGEKLMNSLKESQLQRPFSHSPYLKCLSTSCRLLEYLARFSHPYIVACQHQHKQTIIDIHVKINTHKIWLAFALVCVLATNIRIK